MRTHTLAGEGECHEYEELDHFKHQGKSPPQHLAHFSMESCPAYSSTTYQARAGESLELRHDQRSVYDEVDTNRPAAQAQSLVYENVEGQASGVILEIEVEHDSDINRLSAPDQGLYENVKVEGQTSGVAPENQAEHDS